MNLEGHPAPEYLDMALRNGIDIPARFMMPIFNESEKTINRWCREGWLPCYKHQNGSWWLKTSALTGAELENAQNEERKRISSQKEGKVPRQVANPRGRKLRPGA